jgi:uncharacterized membrane protein YedE/YeeE
MKVHLSALAAGLLFGMGLMLSGMTNPGEVLGFLDWSGVWSPDLIGVLGAAVAVSLIGFQFARRMESPWFEARFPALPEKPVDRTLVMGALLFGVGWGLAGGLAIQRTLNVRAPPLPQKHHRSQKLRIGYSRHWPIARP